MIGEYVNTGRGMNVPISPAVPGAQYRITAWALGNGSRSATPAVKKVTTGEASEFYIYICSASWIRTALYYAWKHMFGQNYGSSVQHQCGYFINQ